MPEIVAKIMHDDGTEESFGPVQTTKKAAKELSDLLKPVQAAKNQDDEKLRSWLAAERQHLRSLEAEKHNADRIERAARGEEID